MSLGLALIEQMLRRYLHIGRYVQFSQQIQDNYVVEYSAHTNVPGKPE